MHRDYLGSILAITDANGNVLEQRQFGAWGSVDKFLDSNSNTVFGHESLLDRGYTGHEHFFEVSLIHMNGRMYDPVQGRFLSPDNFIQDPFNTQNYNRYGYVLNNPLMHVDPSGEFLVGAILSAIVDGVKNVFTHGVNVGSYDWKRTQNAWKIEMGLWKGNFGQILNRFTSENIQTTFGYLINAGHNLFGGVKSVSYYNEATVVETYARDWGGMTISSYIMGNRGITNDPNDPLFQHEYGHVLQSRYSGILYLPKYALPSLFSAGGDGDHNLFWTERDANARAFSFFTLNDSNFKEWDFYFNRITGYDKLRPFDDPANQKALENNMSNLTKFESFLYKLFGSINFGYGNETDPSNNHCDICQ